uniref:Uncharacterized protein n=2 Tax=Percolomonas cosmopolitus TaxID=63605 RepID=A0A7S1PFZ1_9EUKA|mmetsp:Transcript_4744/g.17786  ORF Transcript_4744/g.17786 Transcript_4744/m.17786 type:complete len:205 (+) Transcript_4744:140-754(+)|eukprot:CAMPEP_0117450420 /NCGR_PEP_ID=MMETSP0759-20121206/8459_1 /TAXON_ID=63605 /ORGANISM="Percolomonas cosmopolitus, Strain WS" /LENGTH=204 /DNA_ID=CAMNT_0005242941 /DNA_START=95 /DNA_END=709 /DNA_ORIENTATION=-
MASTLLLHATQQGDTHQVATLLSETRVSCNVENSSQLTPLHYAAQGGYISIMEILLRCGADPNKQSSQKIGSNTPLHIAIDHNYLKVAETLLNYYANPNVQNALGFTALHVAARKGYVECVKMLLARGAQSDILDAQGKTPYYWAQAYQHSEIASLLPVFKYDWTKPQKVRQGQLVRVTVVPPEKKVTKKKKGTKKKGGKKKKK